MYIDCNPSKATCTYTYIPHAACVYLYMYIDYNYMDNSAYYS